jgi:hypothetical protein
LFYFFKKNKIEKPTGTWEAAGFSLHAGVRALADERDKLRNLPVRSLYISNPIFNPAFCIATRQPETTAKKSLIFFWYNLYTY